MKKNTMFTSIGPVILAFTAIFAVKTNKHNGTVVTVYYTTAAGSCNAFFLSSFEFTTGGGGVQATIRTSGGARRRLWANNSCNGLSGVPVHFNSF